MHRQTLLHTRAHTSKQQVGPSGHKHRMVSTDAEGRSVTIVSLNDPIFFWRSFFIETKDVNHINTVKKKKNSLLEAFITAHKIFNKSNSSAFLLKVCGQVSTRGTQHPSLTPKDPESTRHGGLAVAASVVGHFL